jgi:hypothetical protein
MEETKFKEAIAELLKDGKREALAQLIIEYVQPNHLTNDFVSLLLGTRALNPGDALVKKVRTGIKVRTLVPGSIHLASEITVRDRINYVLDGADVKVTYNEWELASGELGSVEDIRAEMSAKLRDYYLGKVFTSLSTIWNGTNTPNNYTAVGGPLTSTALKNAIDYINQTTSGVKAVVGTRAALTPITTFGAGWSDGTSTDLQPVPDNIREIMATGFLGRYYGARIIALDQVYDNDFDHNALLPADKVLVIGTGVGEFITYGDVRTKEWTDMRPTPPQWYLELYQQFGMIIDRADGIFVLDLA